MSMVPVETRLILNDRVLAFPYGQHAPVSVLAAAFELGKKSAPLGVDANPFVSTRRGPSRYPRSETDRYRGAEAVAWLRGHYLARIAMLSSDAIVFREAA